MQTTSVCPLSGSERKQNNNQNFIVMSTKVTFFTKKLEELPTPKNVHAIDVDNIAEKYSHQTCEKGVAGLSNFFNYLITDEWVEIEKPHKERLPEGQRYYLGLVTVLCDRKTGSPIKKGSISLNRLVQPYPAYDGDGIKQVQQIVNIPAFADSPEGQVDYAKKHIVGRLLRLTGKTFKAIKPDYSMGTPSLYGLSGERLQEKEVACFEAVEVEE